MQTLPVLSGLKTGLAAAFKRKTARFMANTWSFYSELSTLVHLKRFFRYFCRRFFKQRKVFGRWHLLPYV